MQVGAFIHYRPLAVKSSHFYIFISIFKVLGVLMGFQNLMMPPIEMFSFEKDPYYRRMD